ncbi:S-layer homology domain-containing protein [Cohnella sp. AR92]|uniref:S-layer homology domain-containing protein n=1 Tax=Cohnella sp. AR92 TaxID=648716 RepID=UPI001315065A|nr:S-layer homology domain-containing protein [Cohnella sp. AR92]
MGNISAVYVVSTGEMTLTSAGASASLAQWQSALRSIAYTNSAITPNTATRVISFTVRDGADTISNAATRTVTVTATDQTPIVMTAGGTTSYKPNTTAVAIDSGVTVSDRDNSTLASAFVSIGSGFQPGDTLDFNPSSTYGNIAASYNTTTGVLTLVSPGAMATLTQWADALRSVTFSTSSVTTGNRTIGFAVSDGVKTSSIATRTVVVTGLPVLTGSNGSASFVAGDNTPSTPVVIDPGLTVTVPSSTPLATSSVAIIGNLHSGEDVLAFVNNDAAAYGDISASYNGSTGTLTLTSAGSSATPEQWQSALRSIVYTNTAITPNTATRTIGFTVKDGAGTYSNTSTRTVTVTATDQTPIVMTTGGTISYKPNGTAVAIDPGVTVADLDNSTLASAFVSIGSGFQPGDTLDFNPSSTYGNIAASYNTTTGVLTLVSPGATATLTQWADALRSVTFSTGSVTTGGNRSIGFAVNDGAKTSSIAARTVAVTGSPILTGSSGSASFVAGDNTPSTPVVIDPGLTVTVPSSTPLATARAAVTGNLHVGEDVLAFVNNDAAAYGNISSSYLSATGELTLTSAGASATPAQWQNVLRSIVYTNTAITPNTATRTISFSVKDDEGTVSNTTTRTVTVAATDQTPVVSASSGSTAYAAGAPAVAIDPGITISDRDSATLASATVSIIGGFLPGDTLSFPDAGPIRGAYDNANGVLSLAASGGASLAQWQSALRSVTFSSPRGATGDRTISFAVSDGTKTSSRSTKNVAVTGSPSGGSPEPTPIKPVINQNGSALDPDTIDTSKPSVSLEVTPAGGTAFVDIPSSILLDLGNRNANFLLEINAPYGAYRVPVNLASLIPGLKDLLAKNNVKAEDISFKITLTDKSDDKEIKTALRDELSTGKAMGAIVDYSITIMNTKTGQSIGEADQFSKALTRVIPMPKNMESMPERWGAFRYNETSKKFEFVAAKKEQIEGVWYVMIPSYSNSVYLVADNRIDYSDVQKHWGKPFIELAAAKGLVQGVGGGKFAPNQAVTRAEFTAMLVRALGSRRTASDDMPIYTDVKSGSWYYGAVAEAKRIGLLDFAGDTSFRPDQPLTRDEMASMLAAVIDRENPSFDRELVSLEGYKDVGSIDTAYLEDIRSVVALRIMTGAGDGTFNPKGESTRAQAAAVLIRTLQALGMID